MYERERNRFVTMLKYRKGDQIHTTKNKKLYQVITELSGQNELNALPDSTSSEGLAEELANYFIEKILNIRKLF